MQEGFSFIDFIIFAAIAFFVVTRFFGHKLPKGKSKTTASRVIDFPKSLEPEKIKKKSAKAEDIVLPENADPLAVITAAEPSFQQKSFLQGAKAAYTMYYEAWAEEDEETLDALLSPRMFDQMMDAIEAQTPVPVVQSVSSAAISDARVNGRSLIVQVMFEATHQLPDQKDTQKVSSLWTFARALNSDDPNWEIQDIVLPN